MHIYKYLSYSQINNAKLLRKKKLCEKNENFVLLFILLSEKLYDKLLDPKKNID